MKLVRTPKAILFDIERSRQSLQHHISQRNYASYWNTLTLLCVYYAELSAMVGEVLDMDLPALESEQDMILLLTDSNQDGEIVSQQAYNERLLLMSELDKATHLAVPVASEIASDVDRELNTLKRGFCKINSLAKKRA